MALPTMTPSQYVFICFTCSGEEMPKPTQYGIEAVSYTHLDVYKRQLLNFGVVGGCAIFFYVLTQLKMLMKRFQTNVCKNRNILVLVMFSAVLIHGCTDVTIFWIQTGMLFLLVYTSTGIHNNVKSVSHRKDHMSIHHTETWSTQEYETYSEESGISKSDIHNQEIH